MKGGTIFVGLRRAIQRLLLLEARLPGDPEGAAAIASAAGFTVELSDASLDVIV